MPRVTRRQEGFTLVELLITVLIIGILSAVSMAAYNGQRAKAKHADSKTALRQALAAVRSYHAEKQTYTGLTTALFTAEEPTLTTGGSEMWVSDGNPDNYRPGGANVDPRKIRLYVYPGGHCVSIGSISRGRIAYMIIDCQSQMVNYMYGGVHPMTFEPGTYYGAAVLGNGLSTAESEIMWERRTGTYDED